MPLTPSGDKSKRDRHLIRDVELAPAISNSEPSTVEQSFVEGLDQFRKMESASGSSERQGKAWRVFKAMLQFGSGVSKLRPDAKRVFVRSMKAWEQLERWGEYDEDLQELIDRLAGILDYIELVNRDPGAERLKEAIENTLTLVEEVSIYVLECLPASTNTDRKGVNAILGRFETVRAALESAVGAETCRAMFTDEHYRLLGQLHPISSSGYDPSRACQEGTRESVISGILAWIEHHGDSKGMLWVNGPAGLGKTAIATSVYEQLANENILAANHFCKRDDPNLRDPLCLINSVIYGLAMRCPTYGRAVAAAIQGDQELCKMHMGARYESLIEKPLRGLKDLELPRPLVVLIDALDECGTNTTRRDTLRHLYDMSQLVPWLKVIVTSRPDEDIQEFFGLVGNVSISSCDLRDFEASNDIRAYLAKELSDTACVDNWPEGSIEQLCEMASGIFIWAATARRYILGSVGPTVPRLCEILQGGKSALSRNLDALYTSVIFAAIKASEEDEKEIFRQCIGAIVVASARRPLSIATLGSLLPEHIDRFTLERVVKSLGTVLHVDTRLDGAVRFYHPSFADYATDPARSGELFIQPDKRNLELAAGCFRIINQQLRFNICSLETSNLFNSQVPDLADRINSNISDQLNYSCTYWTSHLVHAPRGALLDELESLLKNPRILYLIEALSLLGRVGVVLEGILALQDWLPEDVVELLELLHDFYRFISAFYDAISLSAPHLYVSALALAPSSSRVVQQFRPQFPNVAVATSGGDTDWPSWLRALAHAAGVTSLAVSSDGRLLVSGCANGDVQICNIQTGIPIGEPLVRHSKDVTSVGFSPDGTRLVTGSQDGTVLLWDVKERTLIGSSLVGRSEAVTCVAFSPNGSEIISVAEGGITRLLDLESGEMRAEPLVGHPETVVSASFSRDGSQIASANWDNTVQLWDTRAGSLLGEPLVGHTRAVIFVAYSHDGNTIASASCDETVRLWDTRARMAIGGPLVGHSEPVTSLAFSPDDSRVVSGSFDCTVRLWDVQTGTQVGQTFIGHSQAVSSVAFSPNGSRIVSGSLDRTVRLWAARPGPAAVGQHLAMPSSAQPQHDDMLPSQRAQSGFSLYLHPTHQGWASHDGSDLALWLPPHYRQIYESQASYSLAVRLRLHPSAVSLDFSRSAHGPFWRFVARDQARDSHVEFVA